MIRSISADQSSFKTVHFEAGFNVVLADRTTQSTKLDSRNGLGKSTLIDIIHFCLGAGTRSGEGLLVEPLLGWMFTIELEFKTGIITASRNTEKPQRIIVEGATDEWPMAPSVDKTTKQKSYSVRDWNTLLGFLFFQLPTDPVAKKYNPTFRSLISYFIRRSSDAFSTPFEHYRKQLAWDVQVANSYLLELNWKYASDLQLLKDKKKHLDGLKKGLKEGVLTQYLGTIGELEADQVRLRAQIEENQEGLTTFNVLPQYRQLEQQANKQTYEIGKLRDTRAKLSRRLTYYNASLEAEIETDANSVAQMYEQAGVQLPDSVRKNIADVHAFHASVILNRREFLSNEIASIKSEVETLSSKLAGVVTERSEIMDTLKVHGPWEEYQNLTELQSDLKAELQILDNRISTLREIQDGTSTHKIDVEMLLKRIRQDYDERKVQRNHAISMFNENSQSLYNAPGNLVVDIADSGYKFNVEIQRSGSSGIESMKVFCYDLVLVAIWNEKTTVPFSLIHDSILFDGVDERQRALAIQLAASKSEALGFQYICTLNSDMVPRTEFDDDFNFDKYVRLTLTDKNTDGGLLGIRF